MLIGLIGVKRSGKDTVADYLKEQYGFWKEAFAAKLKEIAKDLWDLSDEQVNGTTEQKETVDPRWGKSPRELMQQLGTEVGRTCHDETWICYLMRHVDGALEMGANVVITDVRFKNEARAVLAAGGALVRVARPGFDGDAHASEQKQIAVDFTLANDGDLDHLYREVDRCLQILRDMPPGERS